MANDTRSSLVQFDNDVVVINGDSKDVDLQPSKSVDDANRNDYPETGLFNAIFPRSESLSMGTFSSLTVFASFPAIIYIIAFTKIGFGLSVFYFLSERAEDLAYAIGASLAAFVFLLYLFDCYYWDSPFGRAARKFCVFLVVLGVSAFSLSLIGSFPYAPIVLLITVTPLWMMQCKNSLYHNIDSKTFVSWLSGPLFFLSGLIFVTWIVWVLTNKQNEWNPIISLAEADQSGCEPNFEDYPDCQDGEEVCFRADAENSTIDFGNNCDETCVAVYDTCLNTFILWSGPLLVSSGLLFLSIFSTFLRGDGTNEEDILKFSKIWLFLLCAMWVYASMAGAGAGISTALGALTISAFIASGVFLAVSYSRIEREKHIGKLWAKILEKYGSYLDIARGLLVVTCAPVFLIYFFISYVIQSIRNFDCCFYAAPPTDTTSLRYVGGAGLVTVEARRLIREFNSWHKAKVFTYAIYWGIGFMTFNVIVAQFTVLFLSWLIERTSEMSLLAVTVILVFVGLCMFLCPPVPGVPIYLTLGIVILPVGRETMGIWGCAGYVMLVSLCLKLLACTCQQKLIGEQLSNSVKVRQFVGINTTLIRSMRLVLQEKGFSIAKVCILIGSPDWPCSVLCGIMELPLIPILIGTTPIVFLIFPTMLTGFFTYMANIIVDGEPEFPWAGTAAAVSAAVTAFVQFGSMVVAAFFVEQTVAKRGDELEAIPIDEEVKEADRADEVVNEAYNEVTHWKDVPVWAKYTLISSLGCMIISCFLVQWFQDKCFVPYQLTYTIEENLDGDWTNLVKPLGLVAIIFFSASCIFLKAFTSWAMSKATQKVSEDIQTNYVLQEEKDVTSIIDTDVQSKTDVLDTPPSSSSKEGTFEPPTLSEKPTERLV